MLWNMIDNSDGYYKSKVTEKKHRSNINVIFRIQGGNTDLEALFMKEAAKDKIV